MCQFFYVFLQETGNKGLNICSFLDSAWASQRVDVLRWTGLTVQAAKLLAHPTPPGAAPVDFVRIHLVHLLVRRVVRRPAEEGGRRGESVAAVVTWYTFPNQTRWVIDASATELSPRHSSGFSFCSYLLS